jgi:hypothetical protein
MAARCLLCGAEPNAKCVNMIDGSPRPDEWPVHFTRGSTALRVLQGTELP